MMDNLKNYELFISKIFHLLFSGDAWPLLTKTIKGKSKEKIMITIIFYSNKCICSLMYYFI